VNPRERLYWSIVAGFVGYVAHTNGSTLSASILLAPGFLALWYITLCGAVVRGTRPSILAVALSGATTQVVFGAQCWSLLGYFHNALLAHMAYLAAVGAVFSVVAHTVTGGRGVLGRLVGFTAAWVVAGIGGGAFEWGYPIFLSASWVDTPVFAQLLALGGPWLLDGVIACLGALMGEVLLTWLNLRVDGQTAPTTTACVGSICSALLTIALLGALRLQLTPAQVAATAQTASERAQPVALVQGAVPGWFQNQTMRWKRLRELSSGVYRSLVSEQGLWLTEQRAPWLVLPESVVFDFLAPGDAVWEDVIEFTGSPVPDTIYMTTVTTQPDTQDGGYRYRFLIGEGMPDGGLRPVGDSSKSVATPIADHHYRLDSSAPPLHTIGDRVVGAMVCWDAMFTTLGNQLARDGADVFVVTANDAAFLRDDGPRWHARMSRMRAVETGIPMVFASQAGPSFIADGLGRVIAALPNASQGTVHAWLEPSSLWTPYRYTGRLWWAMALVSLVGCRWRLSWDEE
jgi:apolipoprotein N-acyltransferase